MGVPLLPGIGTPSEWVERVRKTQPNAYATEVSTVLAYLDGQGDADTMSAIARAMPKTGPQMVPVFRPIIERVSEAKAVVFDGDPELDFVLPDGTEAETTENGETQIADVLKAAGLLETLRRVDERTVGPRLAFVRVSYDELDDRIRLDVLNPQSVFPEYDPDDPQMRTAPGALVELTKGRDAKGNEVSRFELWTARVDGEGNVEDARHLIVDEDGNVLRTPGPDESNPYRRPDGIPGEGLPVIPIVAFGDTEATPWPMPRQSLVDAQRTANVRATNLNHIGLVSGYGQWVSQATSERPGSWSGAPSDRGSERSRFGTDRTASPLAVEVATGPDVIIDVPTGRTLENVPIAAQIQQLVDLDTKELTALAKFEGIPASDLLNDAREVSGTALLIERAPLARYREKRLATFISQVKALLEMIRIVWNTHHEGPDRILGVKPRFVPDDLRPVQTTAERLSNAKSMRDLGTFTKAEQRAEATGGTVEDAEQFLEDHADELASSADAKAAMVGRIFPPTVPSPLQQARGATPAAPPVTPAPPAGG